MSPAPRPWYADGLRFGCTACGDCCRGPEPGHVFVDAKDIKRLAKHLELELDAFGQRYLRRVQGDQLSLTEHRNGDCVFWQEGEGCTVYAARPVQCRQFPFWPETLESRAAWREEAQTCGGMDAEDGRLYTQEEIETLLGSRRSTRPGRKPRRLA